MSKIDTFLTKLQSAYHDLDTTNYKVDLQGWMDPGFCNVFKRLAINAANKNNNSITIIEVGTWKGLSTSSMARICKEHGINAKIIAVDTWLGAPEFWTWGLNDPTRGESLKLVNGYPTVFQTFTKNIKSLGMNDIIYPFPMSSVAAADVLGFYGIKADLIYIDASHEYESVKTDLQAYRPLLKSDGFIFGDDYSHHWTGVIRAVDEAFGSEKSIHGIVWVAPKLT